MNSDHFQKVSIIGCGWLGLPLATHLLSSRGEHRYYVRGSTTTPSKVEVLRQSGVEPVLFRVSPEPAGEAYSTLFDANSIVVDIPPRIAKQGEDFHTQQIYHLIQLLKNSKVKQIIYVSSTSVYPEINQEVTEQDVRFPAESAAPALVETELMMSELRGKSKVAILRCAGLMGYDRIPGKYVRGKKNITTGLIPVNYVHRNDVVAIIATLLKSGITDETYNVVAPVHPTRREVYEASCRQFGWELPTFLENNQQEPFKKINGTKLVTHTGYQYQFPDPLQFYYEV
ncbi:SDR family NAD(P)-dependent oxidoreductase [Telluribacter sp.]|jgi:nucleoside-diphosphate-sugar epimerase|uniref:SDR family NAD(P)-dependent oxidoreductase n=1 Tax=Telluribacter sp. TaxID=1978767 RepID=UPI002E0E7147|nr:SDR family NAD(P)-dependent oxidoreductase [Telluribacter sp.]